MKKFKLIVALFCLLSCNNKIDSSVVINKNIVKDKIITIKPVEITAVIDRDKLLKPLLEQIKQQEKEFLPFDEPRHEINQQDGSLRPLWEHAYKTHKYFYEFNGDKYSVFYNKKPFTPQVCADFIVDTIDRTAGTWYENRQRIVGHYDLRNDVKNNGFDPRRLNELIQFMKLNKDDYEFIFDGIGPKVGKTKELKIWLKNLNVQIGDIIVFRGKVPWDGGREFHNHSMFVTNIKNEFVETVTGNPIYPVERTLRIEGGRTPKRNVVYIIRLTNKFLLKLQD